MEYDVLIISFNSKLSEKHFVGFSKVNEKLELNEAIVSYKDFNNHIEPFKKEILKVVGETNVRTDATKILVGFKRDEDTDEILYDFLMQIKKESVINVAKKLSNYFYALEYDSCLEKIQINQDIYFNKK